MDSQGKGNGTPQAREPHDELHPACQEARPAEVDHRRQGKDVEGSSNEYQGNTSHARGKGGQRSVSTSACYVKTISELSSSSW